MSWLLLSVLIRRTHPQLFRSLFLCLPAAADCSFEGLLPIHPQNVEWDQSTKCSQASLLPKPIKRERGRNLAAWISSWFMYRFHFFFFFFGTKSATLLPSLHPSMGKATTHLSPVLWQDQSSGSRGEEEGVNINHLHSSSLRQGSSYCPNFNVPLFKNHWRKKIIKNHGCSHARTENGEMQMQHADPIWAFAPSSVKRHLLTLVNK